jgi:hypothetical protein
MEHSGPHAGHTAPAGTTYNITLQTSAPPQAAEPVEISLVVTEQRIGEPLSEFELLHDRLVHLIIVNEPLTYFAHLHPALENGVFRIGHTFPAEGLYKLWAEVKPAGSESVLVAFRLSVSGSASASAAIDASSDLGYHVKLSPPVRRLNISPWSWYSKSPTRTDDRLQTWSHSWRLVVTAS